MDFTILGALLRTYEHNMKIIHWGACGPKFDRVHTLCDDFAAMIHDDVDWAGETGLRINQNPPSFDQILEILKNADGNYIICQYKLIDYKEAMKTIERMLCDIMHALEQIHESDEMNKPCNMGIKSTLESVYDKYDFQARYLNQRRMMPHAGEHHHDD